MKNVVISWTLPTVRQQGGPLLPADIAHCEIELSADGGVNYSSLGTFTPDLLSVPVNDLPFSDAYIARGRCVDTAAQAGNWTEVPFALGDDSPPGALAVNVDIV